MTEQGTSIAVSIRWMARRDMGDVIRIEHASYHRPWSEAEYVSYPRKPDHIGLVAEYRGRIVGAMICQLRKRKIVLISLVVDPRHRLRGVGIQMVARLVGKMLGGNFEKLQTGVHETNLGGQLFLRTLGFRCVGISEEEDHGDKHYLFEFRHEFLTNK